MIKIWSSFRQEYLEFNTIEWWMIKSHNNFFRKIRTTQERRENKKALEEKNEWGYKVRGKRTGSQLPNSWDDIYNSKTNCKSWKDLYKVKKQYLKPKMRL